MKKKHQYLEWELKDKLYWPSKLLVTYFIIMQNCLQVC